MLIFSYLLQKYTQISILMEPKDYYQLHQKAVKRNSKINKD